MSYFDSNGLLNSRPGEQYGENSPLWTVELLLLQKLVVGQGDAFLIDNLNNFYDKCAVTDHKGLYNQRVFKDGSEEDAISHDQLTAMFCFFLVTRQVEKCEEIFSEIMRQRFRYDNLNPDKPKRWLHPRDFLFYGCALKKFGIFNKPAQFILNMIMEESCNKKYKYRPDIIDRVKYFFKNKKRFPKEDIKVFRVTDGKLLSFVRCRTMIITGRHEYLRLYNKLTRVLEKNEEFGDWAEVFRTYFTDENHPIRKYSEQLGKMK